MIKLNRDRGTCAALHFALEYADNSPCEHALKITHTRTVVRNFEFRYICDTFKRKF
jgi:hypothetical protein